MAVNLLQFYEEIVDKELHPISENKIKEMEDSMHILWTGYLPDGLKVPDSLNFNRWEYRCAYLLLYSTCHSHMVFDALTKLTEENCAQLHDLIASTSDTHDSFNITSLGGGPGPDLLGILTFLDKRGFLARYPPIKVSVVDTYRDWEDIFLEVMKKFDDKSVLTHFTTQDLLSPLSAETKELLGNTHLLCMVKFVSAIFGDKDRAMPSLKRIFRLLQPGTMVLIIDNSGGQYFRDALDLAINVGLQPIVEPIYHYEFFVEKNREPELKREKFGKFPKSSARIAMAILKKMNLSV